MNRRRWCYKMSTNVYKFILPAIYGFLPCFGMFGFLQHRPFPGFAVACLLYLFAGFFCVFNGPCSKEEDYLVNQIMSSLCGAAFYFLFYSFFLKVALLLGSTICVCAPFLIIFICNLISKSSRNI